MACPRNKAMNRGSGYVKPCTGDTELNKKMSQMIAERDTQIANLFPPLTESTIENFVESDKTFTIGIYSFALDTYVIPNITQSLQLTKEQIPDWGYIHKVVDKFVQEQQAVQSYIWSQNRLRLSTYYEVAKLTHASWGACAVHVFL